MATNKERLSPQELVDLILSVKASDGKTHPIVFSIGGDNYIYRPKTQEEDERYINHELLYEQTQDNLTYLKPIYQTVDGRQITYDNRELKDAFVKVSGEMWKDKPILLDTVRSFKGKDIVIGLNVGQLKKELDKFPDDTPVWQVISFTASHDEPVIAKDLKLDDKGRLVFGA